MEAKHTPGPWSLAEVKNDSGRITHLVPIDSEKLSLLTVVDDGETYFGAVYLDSDARLIAAAPDLLKAALIFEEYCDAMDAGDDVTAMLKYAEAQTARRAAIAKATGEQQ